MKLLIVIVNYKVPELTLACLASLRDQIAALPGVKVGICENGSGDDSARILADAIEREGWSDWVSLKPIAPNRGFSGGNNAVLNDALKSAAVPEYFMLLNADTIVRPGALAELLKAAEDHPQAGIVGPRLEWPDGTPQQSCFRDRSPINEFLRAARTAPLEKLFPNREGTLPVSDGPIEPEWLSFACAIIRREVIERIGVLDDGFYLYFDDPDYCRRARQCGWKVLYWPAARVVHLRGQSNPTKSLSAQLKRRPPYWYASRTRYYAKYYGRTGVWMANLLWIFGRCISWSRERLGRKQPHICEKEWLDIWTNWRNPLKLPPTAEGASST